MSEVNINYKGSKIAGMDASGTKTLLTEGKYCEDDIEVVYARPATPSPSFQTKSVTYTPSLSAVTDTVTADSGYDGLDEVDVTVSAVPRAVYKAGITPTISISMSLYSDYGYVEAAAEATGSDTFVYQEGYATLSDSMYMHNSGNEILALPVQSAATITPTESQQTAVAKGKWTTGSIVVDPIPSQYIVPSGVSSITSNGIYDITSFASVDVNVSGGGGGSGVEDGIIEKTISGTYTNSRVTTIGDHAFYNCSSLTTVSFPNVTSIGSYAFYACSRITTASFPNATKIGSSAFYNCGQLTTISFPNVTSISVSAFYGCSHLTTAIFPKATSIGSFAFYLCSSLTTASFPSATTIGGSAFYSCSHLTTTSFPNVTSIASNAFYYCESLTEAIFPKATSIGVQAFRRCSKLMSLYILASSVATLGLSVFISTPMSLSTYTGSFGSIYVPASLVSSYKAANNWSVYSSRITSYVE